MFHYKSFNIRTTISSSYHRRFLETTNHNLETCYLANQMHIT